MATNFDVIQIAGINTATIVGSTGPTGPTGSTGPTGPGAGVFAIDRNGDLMPNTATVTEAFYSYDGNGDIMPA